MSVTLNGGQFCGIRILCAQLVKLQRNVELDVGVVQFQVIVEVEQLDDRFHNGCCMRPLHPGSSIGVGWLDSEDMMVWNCG